MSAESSLRVLVVDDERLAREGLARMLVRETGLIVEQAASGEAAIETLRSSPFDLVFLDVQMRGVDGFGVIRAIGPERMPVVVFTTAHSQYAIRAFEAAAVDYLLKPIDDDRLRATLERAREVVRLRRLGRATQQLLRLLEPEAEGTGAGSRGHRFQVRSGRSLYYVDASAVEWVESADNYARLWVGGRSHLIRESMQAVEAILAPLGFIRVHRTAIVRLDRIKEVRTTREGAYQALLTSGEAVPVSRERRAEVLAAMGRAD